VHHHRQPRVVERFEHGADQLAEQAEDEGDEGGRDALSFPGQQSQRQQRQDDGSRDEVFRLR